MRRRNLALATLLSLLGVTNGLAIAAPSVGSGRDSDSVRQIEPLPSGWRFFFGTAPAGVEAPEFDDSSWQHISVPHSWNHVGAYLPAVTTRINTPDRINKAEGVGWYRLSFTFAADSRDQRIWLEFDAASRIARVWLNGRLLGEHDGGFSRFRIDATDVALTGRRNVLVVAVDNSKPAPGSSTANVLPLAGDFFVPEVCTDPYGWSPPIRLIST